MNIRWLIIPHVVILPGIILGAVSRIALDGTEPMAVILELALCLGTGLILFLAAGKRFGWGDVLLAMLVAAVWGLTTALLVLQVSALTASLIVGVLMAAGRIPPAALLPWAPFYLGTAVLIMM